MTTYTTTAIATNSVTNTVTVVSIANMVPGIPITFSGTTFGGITTGSTYYIGTIIYGYPTSSVTLTSLPGGAVFALTTATGSMTATWASGGQQMVSTIPPGENLNTAFTKINTNFDQIWAAGPVGSNIRIAGDTISTLDTNGDLILNPNGIGNVVANAHVIPDQTRIRNLGSPTRYWDTIYVEYGEVGNLSVEQFTIPVANLHILGGNANDILQTDGTGNLTWVEQLALAGGADTQIQYNNNGLLDGSSSFTFTSSSNTMTVANLNTTGRANLNSVSNVFISGGTAGYVLETDGFGNLNWASPTGNTQTILDQQIAGDNSNVNYTLITTVQSAKNIIVAINGIQQLPNVAYTVLGNTITFAEPLLTTEIADIRFLVGGPAGNGQPGGSNGTVQFNNGAGFSGSANLTYNEITGNLYSANVSVGGSVIANYYYGDGGLLSNVRATANTGDITFANNVISTSDSGNLINIVAPQSTPVSMATGGNAATSQLLWATNIGALAPADTFNAVVTGNTWGSQISAGNTGIVLASNSAAGLQTWTFGTSGTLSSTGSILAGNISAAGNITANVNLVASGNVSGTYVLGNARFMTGIPVGYGNSNVANYLNGSVGNVIPIANISYSLGNSTNQWKELWVSNSTIYINSVPLTVEGNTLQIDSANVVTYSTGSNSEISVSGTVTAGNVLSNGNISATGNITGAHFAGDGSQLTNVNIISNGTSSANIGTANGNLAVTVGGNVWMFDSAGNVVFPDNTFQTTGYQKVAAPATAQGKLGDAVGMVAYSSTATYYCTTDYATETPNNVAATAWNDANSVTMDKASVPVQPQAGASMHNGLGATYPVTGSTDGGSYWVVSTSGTIPSFGGSSDIWTITQIQPDIWVNVAWGGGSTSTPYANTVGSFGSDMGVGPNYDLNNPAVLFSNDDMVIRTGGTSAAGYPNNGQMDIAASEVLNIGLATNLVDATYIPSYLSSINFPYGGNTVNVIAGTNYLTVDAFTGLTYNGNPILATANTGNITFDNTTLVGPSFGNVPSANSSVYIQPTVDSATVYQFSGSTMSVPGNVTAAGNITGNYILGNGSQLTGLPATYGNSNVTTLLAGLGSNTISTTGNISAGYLFGNASQLTGLPATYGNSNVATFMAAYGSNTISTSGNITAGNAIILGNSSTGVYALDIGATATFLSNTVASFTANVNNYTQTTLQNLNTGADATADFILTANNGNDTVNYGDFGIINSGYDNATPTNSLGNIVFAADTYLYAQGNTGNTSQSGGNLAIGTTTSGKNVKIFAGGVTNSAIVANISNTGVAVTGTVSATGNITTAGNFIGNGAALTNVTVSAAGNIVGTQTNVSLVAGSYNWTFNNTGNLTLPGNTFAVNYANNTPVDVVTRFESFWTVPTGNSTQSFTVSASETYYMWVDCNIPNGIITWNATATITNTNVPVVGAQYAWVYNGGGTPIDFTSIPNQFIGTSNTIVRSSVAPSATTNRFDFGINNTSGGNVTVRYGWIQIS